MKTKPTIFVSAKMLFFVAVLSMILSLQAIATIIISPVIPNYDPSDPLTGLPVGVTGTVTLNPAKPSYLAQPAAGSNFMNTFAADVGQYPGWTAVTGAALNGVMNVTKYTAHDYGTARGGADMVATYTRNASDPVTLRWIQMYDATFFGRHIDPFPNETGDTQPFYYTDTEYATRGLTFYDPPSAPAPPDYSVRFETYLASFNLVTKVATIHDGFAWGFDMVTVPEPATVCLLGLGGLLLRRRKSA